MREGIRAISSNIIKIMQQKQTTSNSSDFTFFFNQMLVIFVTFVNYIITTLWTFLFPTTLNTLANTFLSPPTLLQDIQFFPPSMLL